VARQPTDDSARYVVEVSRWIVEVEQTLSEEIPAPPEKVRDFYLDLHNIKLVHPLIVSVRMVSRSNTPDGYLQTYRIRDRIPLGRLAIRVSYRARLHVRVNGDVITEARQFPLVRLRGSVTFEATDLGTRVTERLRISAPRPLAAITKREAVDAHIAMLSGIRRHFSGS
jgi:hypothetical protein